jgi:hypothetical protein
LSAIKRLFDTGLAAAKQRPSLARKIFSPKPTIWHYRPMAFRIHDSVVRGEMDNRVKGIVRGKIWVEGRDDPVMLEL